MIRMLSAPWVAWSTLATSIVSSVLASSRIMVSTSRSVLIDSFSSRSMSSGRLSASLRHGIKILSSGTLALGHLPRIPVAGVVADVVLSALRHGGRREEDELRVGRQRHEPVGKPGGDVKHGRLLRRQHIAMNREGLRRVRPVVDLYGCDNGAAGQRRHVLGFAPVAVPGADETGAVVADHVEATDTVEGEVVDEAERAAIVDRKVALDQPRFSHWAGPRTPGATTACRAPPGGTADSNDATG